MEVRIVGEIKRLHRTGAGGSRCLILTQALLAHLGIDPDGPFLVEVVVKGPSLVIRKSTEGEKVTRGKQD